MSGEKKGDGSESDAADLGGCLGYALASKVIGQCMEYNQLADEAVREANAKGEGRIDISVGYRCRVVLGAGPLEFFLPATFADGDYDYDNLIGLLESAVKLATITRNFDRDVRPLIDGLKRLNDAVEGEGREDESKTEPDSKN